MFRPIDCFVSGLSSHIPRTVSNLSMQSDIQGDALPIVNPNVKVGEICAFMRDKMWKIGIGLSVFKIQKQDSE